MSISLDRSDLAILRKRARRLYGGNLSAAIAEGVRRIREEEGRGELLAWLGDAATTTADERESIREQWRGARLRSQNPARATAKQASGRRVRRRPA